jgi:acyl carrier protein
MSGPGDKNDRCIGEALDTQIRAKLTEFIVANYFFGDTARVPRDDDSLVEKGIIDSTGILELIEFLESHFEVEVSESEIVPENLSSISNLTEFITSKRSAREPTCQIPASGMPAL